MLVTVRTAKKIRKIYFSLYALLFFTICLLYYMNLEMAASKVVFIPKGSINNILYKLKKEGYDTSKLDSFILRTMGSPQMGWINIGRQHIKKGDFLYRLANSKAAMTDITLIPGETTIVALEELGEQLGLNDKKLWELYKKRGVFLEGFIIPETYKVPLGIDEKGIIELLISKASIYHEELSAKIFGNYNAKKWLHFVTLASIIQKEAANTKEMALVSSVIQNRLKKGMKLQMDGTLNYGKYSHIKVTPKRIREDRTRYNTYRYKGVPPYPVCLVEREAILAAIYPAKTDYLYFMKNKYGTHDFTKSYKTHLKNINKVRKSVKK